MTKKKTVKAWAVMRNKKILAACECCYSGQIIALYPTKKIADEVMFVKENHLACRPVIITYEV